MTACPYWGFHIIFILFKTSQVHQSKQLDE